MSINKDIHTKIVNEIIRLNINSYDDWKIKERKNSKNHAHYIMIDDINYSIKRENLPKSEISGNLDWSMTYKEILLSVKNLLNKLKEEGLIYSSDNFENNFEKCGQKNYNQIYKDKNGKKWINIDNDITRLLGARYINNFDSDIKAPKNIIFCDLKNIELSVEFNFRNINPNEIYEKPPCFPYLKNLKNGIILSEYIEYGIPISKKLNEKELKLLSDFKYVDLKYDNILSKNNKIYIVDTEKFSFIWRPELIYSKMEYSDLNLKPYYENLKLFDKSIVLYAALKFLYFNSNYIKDQINENIFDIKNDQDNRFNLKLHKYIPLNINLL